MSLVLDFSAPDTSSSGGGLLLRGSHAPMQKTGPVENIRAGGVAPCAWLREQATSTRLRGSRRKCRRVVARSEAASTHLSQASDVGTCEPCAMRQILSSPHVTSDGNGVLHRAPRSRCGATGPGTVARASVTCAGCGKAARRRPVAFLPVGLARLAIAFEPQQRREPFRRLPDLQARDVGPFP